MTLERVLILSAVIFSIGLSAPRIVFILRYPYGTFVPYNTLFG